MLGTIFALLGLGVYGTWKAGDVASNNYTSEQRSKRNGSPYYIDDHGKFRVVGTGRLCTWGIENGSRVLREHGTHRVIVDEYEEWLTKKNAELKAKGKKFRLVRIPGRSDYVQFENETNRPFLITEYYSKYERRWAMYYAEGDEWKRKTFNYNGNDRKTFKTYDEASPYLVY